MLVRAVSGVGWGEGADTRRSEDARQAEGVGVATAPIRHRNRGLALPFRTHLCLLLDVLGCLQWGQLWGATNTMALEPRPSAPGPWAND